MSGRIKSIRRPAYLRVVAERRGLFTIALNHAPAVMPERKVRTKSKTVDALIVLPVSIHT